MSPAAPLPFGFTFFFFFFGYPRLSPALFLLSTSFSSVSAPYCLWFLSVLPFCPALSSSLWYRSVSVSGFFFLPPLIGNESHPSALVAVSMAWSGAWPTHGYSRHYPLMVGWPYPRCRNRPSLVCCSPPLDDYISNIILWYRFKKEKKKRKRKKENTKPPKNLEAQGRKKFRMTLGGSGSAPKDRLGGGSTKPVSVGNG